IQRSAAPRCFRSNRVILPSSYSRSRMQLTWGAPFFRRQVVDFVLRSAYGAGRTDCSQKAGGDGAVFVLRREMLSERQPEKAGHVALCLSHINGCRLTCSLEPRPEARAPSCRGLLTAFGVTVRVHSGHLATLLKLGADSTDRSWAAANLFGDRAIGLPRIGFE